MPRAIVCNKPRTPEIVEYELMPLQADEVRIKTDFAAPKHGSDLHAFRGVDNTQGKYFNEEMRLFLPKEGDDKDKPYYFPLGNMFVGHITEVGSDVTELKVGDRVAGFAPIMEIQTMKAKECLKMSEDMPWQNAVCYDPAQFAMGGVRDSHIRLGDTCCVMGLGAIGLIAAQMAKLSGASLVIVSDPIEARRKIALENGADYALDPLNEDVGLRLKELTGGKGVDAVIETSGTYPALQQALRGVIYSGTIAVVGWYNAVREGALDLGCEAHMNNAHLFFSRACSEPYPDHPRWNWDRLNGECWRMLSEGILKCENIINPVVSFEDASETFIDCVDLHPEKSVKMGVDLSNK